MVCKLSNRVIFLILFLFCQVDYVNISYMKEIIQYSTKYEITCTFF